MSIIELTYETLVTVRVDTSADDGSGRVLSIQVLKSLTNSPSGLGGFTHAAGVRPDELPSDVASHEPFRREQVQRAIEVLKTQPHPKWTWKEPV